MKKTDKICLFSIRAGLKRNFQGNYDISKNISLTATGKQDQNLKNSIRDVF